MMSLIRSVTSDWNDPCRREQLLAARREALGRWEALAPQEPPGGSSPRSQREEDRAWGAGCWRLLAEPAAPQVEPVVVVVLESDEAFAEIVGQAALAWFGDRGGAVAIDPELPRRLHPARLRQPSGASASPSIKRAAQRMTAWLLADALRRNCHAVVMLPRDEPAAWQAVAESLAKRPGQTLVLFSAARSTAEVAMNGRLRQTFRDAPRTELYELALPGRSKRAESGISGPPSPRAARKIVLGDFAPLPSPPPQPTSDKVATALPEQAAPDPETVAPIPPAPKERRQTGKVLPQSQPAAKVEATPRRIVVQQAEALANHATEDQAGVQRRQALQAFIRSKAQPRD